MIPAYLMSKPPSIISDREQLPLRDKRIGVLIFCAIVFLGFLAYKIRGNDCISEASIPSAQLISRAGDLYFTKSASSHGGTKDNFEKPAPDLAAFFFQPIPVNFADARLIETINGIGPHLAQKIVEIRNARGFFASADDLMAVPGIGAKRVRQLENQLSFQTSL